MAGFNKESKKDVLSKIQKLATEYVNGLEQKNAEENKLSELQAAEAQQLIKKLTIMTEGLEAGVAKLETKKKALETSLQELVENKTSKAKELADSIASKKKELKAVTDEIIELEKDAEPLRKESGQLLAQKTKIKADKEKHEGLVSEMKSAIAFSQADLKNVTANFEALGKKIAEAELSLKKTEEAKTIALNELQAAKNTTLAILEDNEKTKASFDVYAVEAEEAKKTLAKELKDAQLEVEKNKDIVAEQQRAIEADRIFVKQIKDINTQKMKGLNFAKSKLQEIIAKLALESKNPDELKSILKVIKEL